MPAGTPPEKVLDAVKNFAREEFGLTHRYAMVLHTDEPHPHVHVIVKAVSEQGLRLHIKKATLREWRREFARQLRGQGVAANATERAVRGESCERKTDGVYRAALRGESTHLQQQSQGVARELRLGGLAPEAGSARLRATRHDVVRGWDAAAGTLEAQGRRELASAVRRFAERIPPALTERQRIAERLRTLVPEWRPEHPHREEPMR